MLKWIYVGVALIMMVSLTLNWCYQILSVTPGDGNDGKRLNTTEYGYFLHLTDVHLDTHYVRGATIKSSCHSLPESSNHGPVSGYFGHSACDTPTSLAQKTLDWVATEWKDKLDFVVWTGDNARHDWDKSMERNRSDVYESNRIMVNMVREALGAIPVVPSLGNNDVIPHNEINLGRHGNNDTDRLLQFYLDLWQPWIPEDQQQDFLKYGAFVADVGPGLRALSLNSMYFIKKNKAMQGCRKPGGARQHMDWFKQQLDKAQMDGYKVLVLGHVPPSEDNYRFSCLETYTHISAVYSDVIIGHLYGHLNKDHFLLYDTSRPRLRTSDTSNNRHQQQQQQQHSMVAKLKVPKFAKQLHTMYASIHPRPKQLGQLSSFATLPEKSPVVAIQVTPSVLPKYYPTVRLYRYTKNRGQIKLMGYDQYFANISTWEQSTVHDYELLYSTDLYGMKDLSPLGFYDLAKRMIDLRSKKSRRLWKTFVNNIFIHTRMID